jgi:leucyl-tRNA synthetase
MPQWAGSSWYYLRYIDPNNTKSLIDIEKEKNTMPVDVYVGGDHATRHLIYARFWHKFLYDIGVVRGEEPFPRLEFLGFILAEDGRKMSKRWKNVVNPDDMVERFGADAFRLYEMFIGPFENTVRWNTDGLVGTYRFLEKVWKISQSLSDVENEEVTKSTHRTVKKITEDIEKFKFNTAVSQMMILVNYMIDEVTVSRECFINLLKVLAPFAPHITEEIWHDLGQEGSIHLSMWPSWEEKYLEDSTITIPVQVNGKRRGEITIELGITEGGIRDIIEKDEILAKYIVGQTTKKFIYVEGKIVNIVV